MATDVSTELYERVSTLRTDAFALIDDLQLALRRSRAVRSELDVAATLASLQAVANRLGSTEAMLAPARDRAGG